jgi:hypothetical protein
MEVATLPDDAVIHILSKLTLGERCAGSCVLLAGGGGSRPPAGVAAVANRRRLAPAPPVALLVAT